MSEGAASVATAAAGPAPRLACEIDLVSECGPVREENQDVAAAWRAGSRMALIVVDGMGGGVAGREAAEIVARCSLETIREHREAAWTEVLGRALAVAHDAVRAAGRRRAQEQAAGEPLPMGATVVMAVVECSSEAPRLHVAHVGDSRAYLYRGTSLFRLTRDHSLVGRLVDDGLLSEEEALGHPDANVVLRAIGQHGCLDPELQCGIPLSHGDVVLLSTDGLHGSVADSQIRRCLGSAQTALDACQRLLAAALAAPSADNITIGCIKVTGDAAPRRPTRIEIEGSHPDPLPGRNE